MLNGQLPSSSHLHEFKTGDGSQFIMLLTTPGEIEDQLIALNKFEDHLTRIMPIFMMPDGVFLDIGANIGFHTLNILSRFEKASAFCFESNPGIKQDLDRNITLNNWQSRAKTSSVVLSDQIGEFDLKNTVERRSQVIKVQAEPFDSIWEGVNTQNQYVALAKIDTQGQLESVLRGMLKTIAKDRPCLFLAFETQLAQDKKRLWNLCRLLEIDLDYEFFIIHKNKFHLESISFIGPMLKDYSEDILGRQKNFTE